MSRKTKKQEKKDIIRIITSLVTILLGVVGTFRWGLVGQIMNGVFRVMLGNYPFFFFMLVVLLSGVYLIQPKAFKKQPKRVWISLVLFVIVFLNVLAFPQDKTLVGMAAFTHFNELVKSIFKDPTVFAYGGYFGAFIFGLSSWLLARAGTIVLNIVLGMISLILIFTPSKILNILKVSFTKVKNGLKYMFKVLKPAKESAEIYVPEPVDHMNQEELTKESKKPVFMSVDDSDSNEIKIKDENDQLKFDLKEEDQDTHVFVMNDSDRVFENYQLPPISLLEGGKKINKSALNTNSAKEKGKRIIEVLGQFGIEADLLDIHIGPSVTKFEIKPDSNVKINKISSIQDNIMMELAVTSLRIEAPIPGRAAVGIEIPNVEMLPVRLREIIVNSKEFFDKDNIWVALGKNLLGEPITIALNKMPHLLIAGATGSGKSVCINSLITSILVSKHPEELKLLLIDPKKVEFTPYTKIPHLMSEVVTDPTIAAAALKKIVVEMEERYDKFAHEGVRNIGGYNKKVKEDPDKKLIPLPWIVVIIDELADLMSVAGKDVETSIQRITQLARAAGIHLVVATQRPSVDVVTGVIKANIPSRIAFAVSSSIDSRTILDTVGAEKLLGYGDMLYIPMGDPSPTRVQGVYVSDKEVNAVTKYASDQAKPHYDDEFVGLSSADENTLGAQRAMTDPYFEEALEFVITNQRASTSSIQRHFRIGYNRAANLMDGLEEMAIIGPPSGSRPRDVLISDMETYVQKYKEEQDE